MPVLLASPTANSIQGPHLSMYGVCFTCLGRLHSYSSIEQGGIKSFSSYQLLSLLTVFSLFLIAVMLPLLLSFTTIFMLTAPLILLTACLPCSCGLAAQDLSLPLTPILSTSLMQYSQSFILFSGKLWNSLPASVFPPAYDLNCFKREGSRHLSHLSYRLWTFQGPALQWAILFYFCCPWPTPWLHLGRDTGEY